MPKLVEVPYNPFEEMAPEVSQPSAVFGTAKLMANKLFGMEGQERYQTWPEKMVRSGFNLPSDVLSGKENYIAGLRREDVTDIPGKAQPNDAVIERAQDTSGLMGTGGLVGPGGVALGSGPMLRPALKYKEKIYKAKEGQQHLDALPENLRDEFQQMALSGEDISHYNFGFMDHKGRFLQREDALKYAIDNGMIDPQDAKFGTLTSTMFADSKPAAPVSALAKQQTKTPEFQKWFKDSKIVDEKGEPLTVYHGSKSDFNTFDIKKHGASDEGLAGKGFYFTYNPEEASGYALKETFGKGGSPNVIPAHISLKNPLVIKQGVLPDGRLIKDLHKGIGINSKGGNAIKKLAEDSGHDGVVFADKDGKIGHVVAYKPEQIKSSISNSGKFDPKNPNALLSDSGKPGAGMSALAKQNKQGFYSAVESAVDNIGQNKASGDQWLGTLSNQKGVKGEELEFTGLTEFLKGKQNVSKGEIQEYLKNNKVELGETWKGGNPDAIAKSYYESMPNNTVKWEDLTQIQKDTFDRLAPKSKTKYQDYQLPGGENYRELLLTLPENKRIKELDDVLQKNQMSRDKWDSLSVDQQNKILAEKSLANSEKAELKKQSYRSSHWDEPNILAHMRMNDRTIDGKKSLHLEEIQSDWLQSHRNETDKIKQALNKDFDTIAAKMVEAGIIKKICD